MNKTQLFGIAALLLLLVNIFLLFTHFGGGKSKPFEGPKKEINRMLHFDKQQADEYELLIKKHQGIIRPLEGEMRQLKSAFYAQLNEENVAAKDSISTLIGHKQIKIEAVNFEHFQEIKNLCKPEQLGYYNDFTSHISELFERRPRMKKDRK